ncbi:hypothetical protein HYU11_06270 [Candidatus Woesearchaeota archaeon]|nr:hypothetical protein [Candidatus Woesearchaeota archaeon]
MNKSHICFILGAFFWLPLFNLFLGPLAIFFGFKSISEMRGKKEINKKHLALSITGIFMGLLPIIFLAIAYITL